MKKEKDWKRCTGVLIITSVCGKLKMTNPEKVIGKIDRK